MKKIALILLSLCIGFVPITGHSVCAEEDIMNYVVSGTGTFEDPYVFSDDMNNPYLEMFNEHVISTIRVDNSNARHQFTASLTGGTRSASNGGKWIYSSGGASVNTNGSFVYTKINYVNENDTENTYVAMTNSTYMDVIQDTLVSQGIGYLESALLAAGLGATPAAAVVTFFSVVPVASIANSTTVNALASAVVNNNGSLVVQYKHSYNGAWYTAQATVEWDTYPMAYLPGAAYGVGTFTYR